MSEELNTRPMLEALLDGQRQLGRQMTDVHAAIGVLTDGQRQFGNQMTDVHAAIGVLTDGQRLLEASQKELVAKQDEIGTQLRALTREVHDGFDDQNRKIDVLNKRMLGFEAWLTRIDERLHQEITARTR